MNEQNSNATDEKPQAKGTGHALFGLVRDLALASVGVVSVLVEDAATLYHRSIERGEVTVHKAQARLKPRRRKLPSQPAQPDNMQLEASRQAHHRLETAMVRLNVPTCSDIDALTRQIADLEAKLKEAGLE